MSNYLTLAEAKEAISRIQDIYNDSNGAFDNDRLQDVIDNIEAIVDASLDVRYALPITNSSAISFLKEIIIPILRFKTYARFADSEDVPESVKIEYNTSMKLLDKLSRNAITLPGQAESSSKRPGSIYVNVDSETFSSDDLDYY